MQSKGGSPGLAWPLGSVRRYLRRSNDALDGHNALDLACQKKVKNIKNNY
jgi:hypothetical protein